MTKRLFNDVADFAVDCMGTCEVVSEHLLQAWEASEDRSCYRGPNGKPFPWLQTYSDQMGYGLDAYWKHEAAAGRA